MLECSGRRPAGSVGRGPPRPSQEAEATRVVARGHVGLCEATWGRARPRGAVRVHVGLWFSLRQSSSCVVRIIFNSEQKAPIFIFCSNDTMKL